MSSYFWFISSVGMIQFLSLFTPNVPMFGNVYFINHILVFISNFHCVSILIFLYIQHVMIFQPDDFNDLDPLKMRRKSLIWKFFLTLCVISISIVFPITEPIMFSLLSKGRQYQR